MVKYLQQWSGLDPAIIKDIFLSLAIVLILSTGQRLLMVLVLRRSSDSRTHYYWRKGSSYVTVALAVLLIGRIWFEGVTSLATYLGLLSAGVAIALQSLVLNLAGWAFIVWRGRSRWATGSRSAPTRATWWISAPLASRCSRSATG